MSLTTGPGTLSVTDTGVGLAPDEVRTLLATIGRSSKRDELGFSRHEFIGQFGVGLLATFLVADTVEVHSRAAGHPVVRWTADAGGSYVVDVDVQPPSPLPRGRHDGHAHRAPRRQAWFDAGTVAGSSAVRVAAGGVDHGRRDAAPAGVAPWDPAGSSPAALLAYAQDHLGLTPFDSIPLVDPAAGLRGVAYVLPVPVNPAERPRHRVHLKRMLLSDSVDDLLPDWAYFVRASVDTTEFVRRRAGRPCSTTRTSSAPARCSARPSGAGSSGSARRSPTGWPRSSTCTTSGSRRSPCTTTRCCPGAPWVPFETTAGAMTVEQVQQGQPEVRFVTSAAEFRQVAQVAAARGLVIVNAGYVYDADLLRRMHEVLGVPTALLQPTDLRADLAPLGPQEARAAARLLEVAGAVLEPLGCDVAISTFEPASLPSLYLVDRAARQSREHEESRRGSTSCGGSC